MVRCIEFERGRLAIVLKMATVCSDHFSSEDLLTSAMRATLLKFGAVPAIIPQSSDNIPILYETEDETNKENRPDNDNSIGSSIGIVTGASLSYSLEDELDKTNSSSVTLVASSRPSHTESESDTNIDLVKDVLPPPFKKRKVGRFVSPGYIGDCYTSDMFTPTKAKMIWRIAKDTILQQSRKLSNLQQSNRQLRSKVVCLKSLLAYLKKNHYISETARSVIEASLPGDAAQILKRVLKGPMHEKYNPSLRAFAHPAFLFPQDQRARRIEDHDYMSFSI